jgi:hypothetical protein
MDMVPEFGQFFFHFFPPFRQNCHALAVEVQIWGHNGRKPPFC